MITRTAQQWQALRWHVPGDGKGGDGKGGDGKGGDGKGGDGKGADRRFGRGIKSPSALRK